MAVLNATQNYKKYHKTLQREYILRGDCYNIETIGEYFLVMFKPGKGSKKSRGSIDRAFYL